MWVTAISQVMSACNNATQTLKMLFKIVDLLVKPLYNIRVVTFHMLEIIHIKYPQRIIWSE